jgi:hypothetical protein
MQGFRSEPRGNSMITIHKIAVSAAAVTVAGLVLVVSPVQLSADAPASSGESGVSIVADSPWDTPKPKPVAPRTA